jgi:ATP-binding cassette, subfamily C (CFTR/MRP), member 4
LLYALVGELPISSGTLLRKYRTLSYVPQDPFIMDGTVRDNILMGLNYDEEWYKIVVDAVSLLIDFKQLRNGDMTIVGDRGVQCSGGQRARIGLARALYRDADVLVCDDPLSAVDAKVGAHIFGEGIMRLAVERGKCVVLATHQHQFIGNSRCILMDSGIIRCVGSYEECVDIAGGRITAHTQDTHDAVPKRPMSTAVGTERPTEESISAEIVEDENDGKETKASGLVKLATFLNYSRAMGGVWVGIVGLVFFSVTQGTVLATIAIIGKWADMSETDQSSWEILIVVLLMGFIVLGLSLTRALLSFHYAIKASQYLHDKMAKAVLRAKIEFFDTNPLGRILNRFSADVGSNDDLLPHTLFDFLVSAFFCLGSLVTAVIALPFTLIAVPPLTLYFISVRRTFVTTTRELKRIEGLARSPIFAMFSESLSGISAIRANDAVKYFESKFTEAQDAHSRAFFSFIACSRWVGFRMDAIVFVFLAFSSFLAVLMQKLKWVSIEPSTLGLAFTMLLQLAGIFQWCIRQSAEVVNQMVSIERVLGFSELPPEDKLELESDKQLENWPENGSISVTNLNARYRLQLPLSLENVSFQVPDGSHVGIVGRTGSGKSTLLQCLFRLIEAESGSIHLSDIDISKIGLHTLRTKLSVIPQTPILFSGCTIRENLDPFCRYQDSEVESVLRDVHMWHVIKEIPNGWSSIVAEGGCNFSVGQRQLLCLARAILCKNRFLILDEPTANVDSMTEKLLQQALHKSFPDATIISVAHRLDTVIESDFILVLGQGKVLEFGPPIELLDRDGHFASMVRDGGNAIAEVLYNKAKKAAHGRSRQKSSTDL